MTRKKPDLDAAGAQHDDETVSVPRALVDEMSQAIAAMQVLAADRMVGVAKALGVLGRAPRRYPAPPCEHCGVDAAVGLHHKDDCMSGEAVHYRETAIIPLES